MILAKVQQYGVKQCNWVHTMDKKTTTTNEESEETIKNWYTRILGGSFGRFLLLFDCLFHCYRFSRPRVAHCMQDGYFQAGGYR